LGLLPPSTPKLDGASVSRAGSRVSAPEALFAIGDGGGIATVAGSGAVPVPCRGAGATEAGVGAAEGAEGATALLAAGFCGMRNGGGGGPTDLRSDALEASGALAGRGAGRGGGFGDSVKTTPRAQAIMPADAPRARPEHYKEISDDA
jgi:hypothetical protein